ncbi:MAG: hypothetical protein GY722_18205 [bacterium]|nr:hypothetical protein [bacterium]
MRLASLVIACLLCLTGCWNTTYGATVDLGLSDDEIASLLAICPADTIPEEGLVISGDFNPTRCRSSVQSCIDNCKRGVVDDCLHAAFVIQADQPQSAEVLFAWACALGDPGGCTNRAAGIPPDTPLSDRGSCLLRTFEATCKAEDVWGCTMVAIYSLGHEGVIRDLDKAKVAADRAVSLCKGTPGDPVCVSASDARRAVLKAVTAETASGWQFWK